MIDEFLLAMWCPSILIAFVTCPANHNIVSFDTLAILMLTKLKLMTTHKTYIHK
jgi:hypothetical protein